MEMEKVHYDFAVYVTQGGGLVRWLNGVYVFVEAPEGFPELTVGSIKPPEWDVVPANDLARCEMREAEDLNDAFNEFFDTVFDMAERGEMSLEQVERFIDIARRHSR